MPPTTEGQRLKEAAQMEKAPIEVRSKTLLRMAGQEFGETETATLSLMIWGARERGDHEMADLLARMNVLKGPKATLKEVLGAEAPVEQIETMGPQEAADEMLMVAHDRLFV